MQFFQSRVLPLFAIILLILLVYLVYAPGLTGPFVFDDAPNITENPAIKITELSYESFKNAAFSIPAGPLYRPVSFVSFAINYYLFELDPFTYKVTNLVIHLGVGCAIFWCAFLLYSTLYLQNKSEYPGNQKIFWVSLLVAAIFLLHPFNVSSVLYVVQRMNSLAALFMFISLGFYLLGRITMLKQEDTNSKKSLVILISWVLSAIVFFPLAIFSKENALLLPFLVLVVEGVLLRWRAVSVMNQRQMKFLRMLLWFGVVIVVLFAYLGWERLMMGYQHRDFGLAERLLTEPLILFRYLSLIILPINRGMTFYHDDISAFTSLTDGAAFLYILFWLSLVVLAFVLKQKAKWFSFAVLWFLVGHSMESSFIALELAHEHRNYVPMFGIFLAAGSIFLSPIKKTGSSKLFITLAIIAVLVLSASTYVRTLAWSDLGTLVERQQRLNPESPRANYAVGQFLFAKLLLQTDIASQEDIYKQTVPYFLAVNKLDPTDFSGYLALFRLDDQMGYIINKDWIDNVLTIMRRVPLSVSDLTHVQDFLHCQLNGYCKVDLNVMNLIVDAVLMNPTLPKGFETTLKADIGIYLSMNNRHRESARYLVDVVSLSPEWWVFRLAAVKSLLASNQFKEATSLLQETTSMDVPNDYKETFSDLIKNISNMENPNQ